VIYITGDLHGAHDIHKLTTAAWPEQKELSKDDFLIVCGDFGFVWAGDKEEEYWLKWLDSRRFTTLFVDGNHENHQMLNALPVTEFCGGRVHQVSESVYHLMRGEVYLMDGKKFFTMGGAESHDKVWRKEGGSWWAEELPSPAEYQNAVAHLSAHGWRVDYIISHCCASSVQEKIFPDYYAINELTQFFEEVVKKKCAFDKWYFGHYHISGNIDNKYFCTFERIRKLGE
jgi:DNA repair exonuclease SbcCD nuclease subunit